MNNRVISAAGDMMCHCIRLRRGEDLLESIRRICKEKNIQSGVILSGVGCLLEGRVRDASGVNVRYIPDHCEIVSLNGTVSAQRCHVHIALSFEDMTTVGGHLCPGCIVNTTCELVIGELPGIRFGVEEDPETGYDELIFCKRGFC
jgi:predicted DNA-binding protein with PD1-like motif